MNIDPVASPYYLKAMRHLYDTVDSQVSCLKLLGVCVDTNGSLLSSVLLNKLPQELRLNASRHVREDEWTLNAIMDVNEREVTARERALGNSCQGLWRTP